MDWSPLTFVFTFSACQAILDFLRAVVVIRTLRKKFMENSNNVCLKNTSEDDGEQHFSSSDERKLNQYFATKNSGDTDVFLSTESDFCNDKNSINCDHLFQALQLAVDSSLLKSLKLHTGKFKDVFSRSNSFCGSFPSVSNDRLDLEKLLRYPLQFPAVFQRDIEVHYVESEGVPYPKEIRGIPWKYLNDEWYRLVSYATFPSESNTAISTFELASKGFAYVGNGTDYSIICCFCKVKIVNKNDVLNIDEAHKHLNKDCPMVQDPNYACNISIKNRYPRESAAAILKQLPALGQNVRTGDNNSNKGAAAAAASHQDKDAINAAAAAASSQSTSSQIESTHRTSQPSDEGASSVVVTNTSDLADGDMPGAGQSTQSSQIMDDFPAVGSPSNHPHPNTSSAQTPQSNETVSNPPTETNNTQQPTTENSNQNEGNTGDGTTYEELGIVTARPKRPEYAVLANRLNSFKEWPTKHHMKPNDLAKAGYFYTGYSDCARCFYCGGGLRNWEAEDNVWVEHARWFPKCAFLRQEIGNDFISAVQAIGKERDEIKYDDVIQRLKSSNAPTPLQFKERIIERDPAVLSVVDNGFDKKEIFKLALELRKEGEFLSSDKLYEAALQRKIPSTESGKKLTSDSVSIRKGGNENRDKETITALRSENGDLRQQTICKICMDTEVAVVFLPCGHFVSCTECSCALSVCPLCRVGIKGIIRAYIG